MESMGQADRAKARCGQSIPGPLRVLMLATNFDMPYRILRCARAAGAETYVLGNAGAKPMRFSRHCRQFFFTECIIDGDRDEAIALEINCLARDLRINLVIAGDTPSTRSLIANRDLIEAPCFPMPSLDTFDELNDKWRFARLCEGLGILHPATRSLPNVAALEKEISANGLAFPFVAKPPNHTGSRGILIFDGSNTRDRLKAINYRPVLVEEFIAGEDIGASVYARKGRIEACITHHLWHRVYSTFANDGVFADIAKVVEHYGLDGVYNFDMRLAPDGRIFFLECNPRFFWKINLSMIAGINFVGLGLRPAAPSAPTTVVAGVKVRLPRALALSLLTSGRCSRRDWAMAAWLYLDPLPYLMEKLGLTA
jgi:predicted ATP-grasp superfamily ATP-dependent carboligase